MSKVNDIMFRDLGESLCQGGPRPPSLVTGILDPRAVVVDLSIFWNVISGQYVSKICTNIIVCVNKTKYVQKGKIVESDNLGTLYVK